MLYEILDSLLTCDTCTYQYFRGICCPKFQCVQMSCSMWDTKFSKRWIWRVWSSRMWHHV